MNPPPPTSTQPWDDARQLLGVLADADTEQLRAAYLDKVRQHPPDRDPETFERIRDAYELLKNPRLRAMRVLVAPDPDELPYELFAGRRQPRRFTGPQAWLDMLKEKPA